MEETLLLKKGEALEFSEYNFPALNKALQMSREEVIKAVKSSNLLGRGGAGFPTGLKWELAAKEEADHKYLICNADEGEPGTFKDRYLLENKPLKVLEGIILAGYAVGADEGYIYIRGEYDRAIKIFRKVIAEGEKEGVLGENILESGFSFKLQLVKGAGAYVCGDETSLLNSIEGKRARSRIKPPYPVQKGLFDRPTVVNNVETLVTAAEIIKLGVDEFLSLGTEKSRGTKLVCLSGDIRHPGIYEVKFGQGTLHEIINEFGGGMKEDVPLKFVIPGGISTPILLKDELDIPYTYEDIAAAGSGLGSGAVVVVGDGHDLVDLMVNVSRFFMDETCGTCFPCREGNRQVHHILKAKDGELFTEKERDIIKDIGETIHLAARCGLGQTSLALIGSMFDKLGDELVVRGESYVKR